MLQVSEHFALVWVLYYWFFFAHTQVTLSDELVQTLTQYIDADNLPNVYKLDKAADKAVKKEDEEPATKSEPAKSEEEPTKVEEAPKAEAEQSASASKQPEAEEAAATKDGEEVKPAPAAKTEEQAAATSSSWT